MTQQKPSYDDLFFGAFNAAATAGALVAGAEGKSEEEIHQALEVAKVVLGGGQIFATLALAESKRRPATRGKDKEAEAE